jgi:ADP-ribosyl-[dinitrogen reductase] hydrolase
MGDNINKVDRIKGALYGLACGDALGTTVEFRPRGTFKPVTDIVGGGVFKLNAGEWTDDTSQALCMLASLVTHDVFHPIDIMDRFIRWYNDGYLSSTGTCFDIGNTTISAFKRYLKTGDAFAGSTDVLTCGNGSIMRLAPVPMYYHDNMINAITVAGLSSMTTHAHEDCIDSCRFLAKVIWMGINGFSKKEILSSLVSKGVSHQPSGNVSPALYKIIRGEYKSKDSNDIRGKGYVLDTLEASLWAFYKTDTFEDGARLVVNLGDDADTTGAVYGQIAGAFYGYEKIPASWREKIVMRTKIDAMIERLIQVTVKPFNNDNNCDITF